MKSGLIVVAAFVASSLIAIPLDTAPFHAKATLKVAGYTGAAALVDFPVMVRLREGFPAGFSYADAGADGAGIRFADAEGNLLPHDVDTWNAAGESTVWVKLPSLTQGASLHLYWKAGEAALPVVMASDVWTKYVAVLHGASYSNASASGLACSAGATTAGCDISRVGGAAYDIVENSKGIQIANPVLNGNVTTSGGVTISGWFRPTKLDASNYNIVLAASEDTWNTGGFLALWVGCNYISVAVDGAHQGQSVDDTTRIVSTNVWEHLAFSYAGSRLNIYEDGNAVYSNADANTFIDGGLDNWIVGSYGKQTVDSFIGQMDEIRFYNGEASPDWIKAEYDAAIDPNFLEPAKPVSADAFAASAYLQALGYSGESTLVDFPVPVRLREGIPNGFAYGYVVDPMVDIRFFDIEGNLLPHEVDTWNPAGESLVWVRLSVLPPGGQPFRMAWRPKTGVTLPANVPSEVWTKYVAVLHGDNYDNAAPSGLVCTSGGTTAGNAASKLGASAYDITQNTMGLLIANPVKNNQISLRSGVTLSGWFYPTKTDASSGNVVLASNQDVWNNGGFLALWGGYEWFSVAQANTQQTNEDGSSAIRKDTWQHIAFSYGGPKLTIYDDAVPVYANEKALYFADPGFDNWVVGSYLQQTVDSFIGQMDEIRLYDGIASADWIKAEYDAATIGNFVSEVDPTVISRATWTNNGARGDVTDPKNWICYNRFGDVVEGVLPTVGLTVAKVGGETSFNFPANSVPNWLNIIFENAVLTNACDWSGLGGAYKVNGTLDLNGFDLRVRAFPDSGTITDATGGAALTLDVPEDEIVLNPATVLTGGLKFIKEGAGTFQPGEVSQSYTGGTEIRAGLAENNRTPGVAAYGPAMSTITVRDGATFDWKGAAGTSYSLDLAGTGTNGQGALYNSVPVDGDDNFWQLNRIANITLSADATFDCSGGLMGLMYEESNPALHEITLNGHTLTLNSEGEGWEKRFFLRGIKTMDTGTILMKKMGGVFYGPASDLASATLEVVSADQLSFETPVTVGTFIDHRSIESCTNRHSKVFVTRKFKPFSAVPTENVELGTETVKKVSLDLSELAEPFNITHETPALAVTFAANSVITVEPGERLPAAASKSLQLVAWNEVPGGVEFVLPKELEKRRYSLDVRETGLFLSSSGMIILVR